ncbi:uncharacterized protein LOC130590876 isoform X2 [Beta vulgaris subsp. vulgaris]|uniref:uncharacterized protein LOC130590876 isoform X2 n=1 Tax=Beta vulgaris subsp. vulgaris TaxID=3555 RepID=UPI00254988F2|nr:uncharacterized protein LOC130590876 isoform X2 [Beta vulgaris subsp. vulgaris]
MREKKVEREREKKGEKSPNSKFQNPSHKRNPQFNFEKSSIINHDKLLLVILSNILLAIQIANFKIFCPKKVILQEIIFTHDEIVICRKKKSDYENYSHPHLLVQFRASSPFLGFRVQSFDWIKGFIFLPFKFKVRVMARVFRGSRYWVPLSMIGVGLCLMFLVLVFSIPAEGLMSYVSPKPPGCRVLFGVVCWWFCHRVAATMVVCARAFIEVIRFYDFQLYHLSAIHGEVGEFKKISLSHKASYFVQLDQAGSCIVNHKIQWMFSSSGNIVKVKVHLVFSLKCAGFIVSQDMTVSPCLQDFVINAHISECLCHILKVCLINSLALHASQLQVCVIY